MPSRPGDYTYSVNFRHGDLNRYTMGRSMQSKENAAASCAWIPTILGISFGRARASTYFLNGTTAFFLMGWDSEQVIRDCIDRLHSLGT